MLVSENVSAKFELRFTGRLDRELASHSRRSVTGLSSNRLGFHYHLRMSIPIAYDSADRHLMSVMTETESYQ